MSSSSSLDQEKGAHSSENDDVKDLPVHASTGTDRPAAVAVPGAPATKEESNRAVRDLLTKRAALEAVQYLEDLSHVAEVTRSTGIATGTTEPHRNDPPQPQKTTGIPTPSSPANANDGLTQSFNHGANDEVEDDDLLMVVAERASLATAEELRDSKLKGSSKHHDETVGGTTNFNNDSTDHHESATSRISHSSNRSNSSGTTSEAAVQQPTLQRTTHQQQQPPARPGAYMGAPGEALQRTNTLRFSLVGASATAPMIAMNSHGSNITALSQSQRPGHSIHTGTPGPSDNGNHNSSRNQGLAVANIVEEDPEAAKLRPSADPVDLELLEQRQRQRKRQLFILLGLWACCCFLAAIVTGIVIGTKQRQDRESTSNSPITTAPQPSPAPSMAPTGVLEILLESLPMTTLANLDNGSEVAQWQAWHWLANHPRIHDMPEYIKTRLFALACFYYAFEGEHWFQPIRERWMQYDGDGCFWHSSAFGVFAKNGSYTEYPGQWGSCTYEDDYDGNYMYKTHFSSLHLEDLDLAGRQPRIPPEISLLTSLSRIQLSFNDIAMPLSALFPSTLYQMSSLQHLVLYNNQLSGPIPSELGLLTALSSLKLDNNEITGTIPTEIGQLVHLIDLNLYNNRLSGALPSELGQMTALTGLRLFGNELLRTTDPPTELGLLTNLTVLVLD